MQPCPYLVAVTLGQAQRDQVGEVQRAAGHGNLKPEQAEQDLQGRAALRHAQRGNDLVPGEGGAGDRPEQVPYGLDGVSGLLEEVAYAMDRHAPHSCGPAVR